MKKVLTILISLFFILTGKAQNIGIVFSAPNASSILEIKANTKGLLIPRTSTASRTAISNPAKGLMVYDTTTNSFWYYNSTAWTQIGAASGNGWSLAGNAGTSSTNFIGTTDEQSLVFKVNNKKAGFIDNSTYETGTRNTAFGLIALNSNSNGADNSAIGYGALYSNLTGKENAALGKYSLFNNNANNNTALGFNSMFFNTSGTNNTAIGSQALQNNTIGSSLTAIGSGVDVDGLNVYNNSTALGYGAIITGSNRIQLGNNAVTEVYAGTGGATLITGGLKVTGGSPEAGKVLTSDANGLASWKNQNCDLSIGQTYQGGLIFYLDVSGCHGLIADLNDLGVMQMSNIPINPAAYADWPAGGKFNTNIIAALGGSFAAVTCKNSTAQGYNDWYLPSITELHMMYLTLHLRGQGNFNLNNGTGYPAHYWSSTQISSNSFWHETFLAGVSAHFANNTGILMSVRAIRSF